jgi:hypothetical protein
VDTELHDCGIVYAPKNYFLCVMTDGNDLAKLEKMIRDVSKTVYNAEK